MKAGYSGAIASRVTVDADDHCDGGRVIAFHFGKMEGPRFREISSNLIPLSELPKLIERLQEIADAEGVA
ncbi:hypothetical protein [Nonomuraea sp. B19D2]|uniref:hypothetical protein n=1 Tax=Nonomuraea sp. B19D2 TaxID=3159561 RepID=UPI0032DB0683